ncbi:MAG: hypothetical protein M3141_02385, partial [Actinomycetota bacterium]|nr:hypothetical protein [Actinomycetota bacterium]
MTARPILTALLVALAALVVAAPAAQGTTIRIIDYARFGPILFDGRGQAIYAFTYDRRNLSRCYGACARAWPPVYTRARPVAGRGVR